MSTTLLPISIDPSLADHVINLLQQLIAIPSFSKEENKTATCLESFFREYQIPTSRKDNNVWVKNKYWDKEKPTLLLNSHHDTVRPNAGWQRDPFQAIMENDRLYGLGSNDAGGPLVSLIATFLHFYEEENLPVNLILAMTAEEEISGANGVASVLPDLGDIWAGIVGEPTSLQMATAERGLIVIDAVAKGKSGHAARNEGVNALYIALEDVATLRRTKFTKVSPYLGAVKTTVTQIQAGTQHNVVPAECHFVIDVRTNEHYSNQQIFEVLQEQMQSDLKARSFRLNASGISEIHPLVKSGTSIGLELYGSPTLSDQALMDFPTLKLGPGESARSHTADEYILLSEIRKGIQTYVNLVAGVDLSE